MKVAFVVAILCSLSIKGFAADTEKVPNAHIFGPLLNKRVTLDALAWYHTKGISGRVVLPSGTAVYISDPYIAGPNGNSEPRLPQGKLVRITGVFTFEHEPPVPLGVQGYGGDGFHYFALKLESFKVIDRAELEFPKHTPEGPNSAQPAAPAKSPSASGSR
jgi:hypothetical protein